jgi:DNA-binding NtrC family response regulator
MASEGNSISSHVGMPIIPKGSGEVNPSLHIEEDVQNFIKNSAIGDITMEDLEREVIERTLKFFNNNRRASAKSLNMSERTLYRKIDQYGLERKIKLNE